MKPLLSVCMIVKNEEKVLGRCLESISGIADEIIIVDTGSVDQTKEIAQNYTENIYNFVWVNDFSKARNYAASKASGEWIFVIDADEFVDRESFEKLKIALYNNHYEYNIIGVQIVSFVGEKGQYTALNYHERIYRNNSDIAYYRSIHEKLAHENTAKENRGIIDFQLYHSGYLENSISEKRKTDRNITLLLNNEKKESIDYFYIGNEFNKMNDLDKAIANYQKSFSLKPNLDLDWVNKLLLSLADCLHRSNRDNEALEVLTSCEEIYPNIVDYKYFKATIFFDKGQYNYSKRIFEDILLQKDGLFSSTSKDFLEFLPLSYLGEIYENENDLHKAVESYSKALSLNETDDKLWTKLVTLLAKHSSLEDLTEFLNDNMLTKSTMSPIRVAKILLSVPNLNVQKLSRSFLNHSSISSEENDALLMKNLQLDRNDTAIVEMIIRKSAQEVVTILSTDIFTIVDFILLTLKTGIEELVEFLYRIEYDQSLNNLYDMIFKSKSKKLSKTEEKFFITLCKQAEVLSLDETLSNMKRKKAFLSKESRRKLNEIG